MKNEAVAGSTPNKRRKKGNTRLKKDKTVSLRMDGLNNDNPMQRITKPT